MNPSSKVHSLRPAHWAFLLASLLVVGQAKAATTEALPCSPEYQITQDLASGARWEMCWEPKPGYAYQLTNIIFTTPNNYRLKVLDSLHVAQLFVPYDDNGQRYRDLSYGVSLVQLAPGECQGGQLLTNQTLCLARRSNGLLLKDVANAAQLTDDHFAIFGYYGLGKYYYIFQYSFFADGAIEPALGASGSLQRFAGTASTGWPIGSKMGVNHNHLAMWRMDFDIDGVAGNLVQQLDMSDGVPGIKNTTITPIGVETRVRNDLGKSRFWRVLNPTLKNANGNPVSFAVEPAITDQIRVTEDFTQHDFFVTEYHENELLVDNGLVSFVNGEILTDPVVWYAVNFHHVPREEDDVRMPVHWQSFRIVPRDLSPISAQSSGPVLSNPGPQSGFVGIPVDLTISATDPAGGGLAFSATGLPDGLSIDQQTGRITGAPTAAGTSTAVVNAVDSRSVQSSITLTWLVSSATSKQVFQNSQALAILDNAAADIYPLEINVAGLGGVIKKVAVSLIGLSHSYPADLDIILVSPSGKSVALLSDVGGGTPVLGIDLTFDDAAATSVLDLSSLSAGRYRPGNVNDLSDVFPSPAPARPYATTLSAFNGQAPNGVWKLYVRDDAFADVGSLSGGYQLEITSE